MSKPKAATAESGALEPITSTINWNRAGEEHPKPDSDRDVLLFLNTANVWPGWWEAGENAWHSADGQVLDPEEVLLWAEMPANLNLSEICAK